MNQEPLRKRQLTKGLYFLVDYYDQKFSRKKWHNVEIIATVKSNSSQTSVCRDIPCGISTNLDLWIMATDFTRKGTGMRSQNLYVLQVSCSL